MHAAAIEDYDRAIELDEAWAGRAGAFWVALHAPLRHGVKLWMQSLFGDGLVMFSARAPMLNQTRLV